MSDAAKTRKGGSGMLAATLVMAGLAAALLVIGHYKGGGRNVDGLMRAGRMTLSVLPILVAAFVVAGMIEVLVPRDALARWVGGESGARGIVIGTIAGGFTPGGPYVSLPIVAGLLRSGAAPGVMVAFLTSWSLWAVSRLPMEVGLLGWKFTAARLLSTFFFPPIAGYIAQIIFARWR